MTTIAEIYEYICELAPLDLQMDFDNSGFQLGRKKQAVSKCLLALDVTDTVLEEAKEIGAELIISHHPLIFRGVKNISSDSVPGERLLQLAENGIAVISMHTNLDIAEGGVNDVLIRLLGAEPEMPLDAQKCGRIGHLPKSLTMPEFISICKQKLNANGIRYYSSGRPVHKLAVMGGAGGDSIDDVYYHGCDTYVSADIKYHQFQLAEEYKINLIDADHFCTENPVMYSLQEKLLKRFSEVDFIVSKKHGPIIKFA